MAVGLPIIIFLIFIIYLTVYPELSDIRQRCNDIKVGMQRDQVDHIMSGLLNDGQDIDMRSSDEKHIYLLQNGVDCSIDFNGEGIVIKVTTAVDGL